MIIVLCFYPSLKHYVMFCLILAEVLKLLLGAESLLLRFGYYGGM